MEGEAQGEERGEEEGVAAGLRRAATIQYRPSFFLYIPPPPPCLSFLFIWEHTYTQDGLMHMGEGGAILHWGKKEEFFSLGCIYSHTMDGVAELVQTNDLSTLGHGING